jgi:Mn-dependent DtxR family transcriptional regulator
MTNTRLERDERAYLLKVFELTEHVDRNGVPLAELEEGLGLAESKGAQLLESLVGAGMIVWPSKGMVMLTEQGLRLLGTDHEDVHRAEASHRHRTARAKARRETMPYAGPYSQPQVG